MSATKPEFVVFYAWQSDRSSSRNRYFIQEAADEAATLLNADPACAYTIRIDQDTLGVPGLCDIPATILRKIDAADAFLCDLTYVAQTTGKPKDGKPFEPRLCSNPNVLFELGYAFHAVGHERIICLMNEHYGPVAKQIFDLAHRRFPLSYRLPHDSKTKSEVKAELAKNLADIIKMMVPLGRRAEAGGEDRAATIRRDFEERVKQDRFHGLTRRNAAIAVSIIPTSRQQHSLEALATVQVWPPGMTGGSIEHRGTSILWVAKEDADRPGITEVRQDGVILSADCWVLDPHYHPEKSQIVPSSATEQGIFRMVASALQLYKTAGAAPPFSVNVSLLSVHDYHFLVSNSSYTPPFKETDIIADPVILSDFKGANDRRAVAELLRAPIDFIWREFGEPYSGHYTQDGQYTQRFF